MDTCVLRLKGGTDLKIALEDFVKDKNIKAACLITCIGSLKKSTLRFANQNEATTLTGKYEIISLTGTLSINGLHLHIAIADEEGNMKGGHLMPGCEVYTTAEIVIGIINDFEFFRETDPESGYKELLIKKL